MVMNGREPRGLQIGRCIVPLDGSATCNGRRVEITWLDGYYIIGGWLCEEVSGLCIKVPRVLLVALKRLERRVGVVRARLVY
jgi:hypothetical protein